MTRRLIITVDVEAFPKRSSIDPLERLIWGRFPEGTFGIGEMMSIARRHNIRLTMFLDYAEECLYGSALRDVGREIHRQGHDLQLHLHPNFLSNEFYETHALKPSSDLNRTDRRAADAFFDFLCDRHYGITGLAPLAFRGGSYRFSLPLLQAMRDHGVPIDSTYNASRETKPIDLGPMPMFRWAGGPVEVPISTTSYRVGGALRHYDNNFNSYLFKEKNLEKAVGRHVEFLNKFYAEQGDHAVAVLVMHSWSFLRLDNAKRFFSTPVPEAVTRFDLLLSRLTNHVEFINCPDVVRLIGEGYVASRYPVEFCESVAQKLSVSDRRRI